jgi:hypothetical protein
VNHPVNESPQSVASLTKLVASCAILAAVIGPTAIVVAGVCGRGLSVDSLRVAAIAGVVCWVAAATALAATFFANRSGAPIQGVLAGMLFRMGLPLAVVLTLPRLDERLAAGGLTFTILGVYLVALAVETALSLKMVPSATQAAKAT